jgi:integrase/recombinase XerD
MTHYLGLRAKEVAALRIGDVYDFKTGEIANTLRLTPTYTKGGSPREISMSNTKVIAALEKYIISRKGGDRREIRYDDPLFRSQSGKHFSPNSIASLFIKLYNNAGLTRASSHSGRRSLITNLSEAGIDLYSISKIVGHQSIETTARYVNENPERLRRILMDI